MAEWVEKKGVCCPRCFNVFECDFPEVSQEHEALLRILGRAIATWCSIYCTNARSMIAYPYLSILWHFMLYVQGKDRREGAEIPADVFQNIVKQLCDERQLLLANRAALDRHALKLLKELLDDAFMRVVESDCYEHQVSRVEEDIFCAELRHVLTGNA
jgi:hypothetical protein